MPEAISNVGVANAPEEARKTAIQEEYETPNSLVFNDLGPRLSIASAVTRPDPHLARSTFGPVLPAGAQQQLDTLLAAIATAQASLLAIQSAAPGVIPQTDNSTINQFMNALDCAVCDVSEAFV